MFSRRGMLGLFAGSLVGTAAVHARAFPVRPVRLVVPYAPGGATDLIGRLLAEGLSATWNQSVTVENRDGASGNVGAAHVAEAAPDGHTALIVSVSFIVNRFLFPRLPFDPDKDFAAVSLLCRLPNIMVVPVSSPARSVAEFIAYARRAAPVTYASSGAGSSVHLAGELFARAAGVQMLHLPFRGSAPALADLEAGRADVMFDNISSALPRVRAGALRALAVTGPSRVAAAPELPPIADTLPGFDAASWFALLVPRATPAAAVAELHAAAVAVLRRPQAIQRLEALGAEVVGSSPPEAEAHLAAEARRWGELVRAADIRLDR